MISVKRKAVLFDFDGVIIDSGELHFKAWQIFCSRYGRVMTYEEFKKGFGQTNRDILQDILGRKLSEEEINKFSEEKEEIFRSIAKGKIKLIYGAADFIRMVRRQGIATALVSSTPCKNIDFILKEINLAKCFDVIISSEDVRNGKPDPEGYLKAANLLSIDPADCIVIEDAIAGIQAALAAKMKCIAITTTQPAEKLIKATYIVNSFAEIKLNWLK